MDRNSKAMALSMFAAIVIIILFNIILDLSMVPWWAWPIIWFGLSAYGYQGVALKITSRESTNDLADKLVNKE